MNLDGCSWDWSANNQLINCMRMNQRKVMDWMICGLAMLFGERFPGYVEDAGWRDHVRKLMLDGSGISQHSTVTTEMIININITKPPSVS